jgi:hypothetical protein
MASALYESFSKDATRVDNKFGTSCVLILSAVHVPKINSFKKSDEKMRGKPKHESPVFKDRKPL